MYVSSPEEIRAKLEAGRAAIASRLHALADEIEALRLEDAAEALSWLGTGSRGCYGRRTASSALRVVAARPDRPHRDDGAGRLRQTLVEHGQARDAGSEVRLGDDRVTPVDRLGLVPRELHRNRPRHARALRARVSCWHCSSEQARTHQGHALQSVNVVAQLRAWSGV